MLDFDAPIGRYMIKSICFSEKTIIARRDKFKIADPGLFEKAIHAFALLGHIAESRMDFIFKGGTSLLLHIPQPQRLSIDIDILCSETSRKLEELKFDPDAPQDLFAQHQCDSFCGGVLVQARYFHGKFICRSREAV